MAKLIKSKQRVKDFGEVFTPIWVVNEMLDELEKESDAFSDVGKTFLEPTCGTGNFVVEIYRRKLNRCKNDRAKAEIALRSLWCIELLEDNMQECRQRVKDVFAYYGWIDLPFDEVFEKQFLIGDSLKIMKQWEEEEKKDVAEDKMLVRLARVDLCLQNV